MKKLTLCPISMVSHRRRYRHLGQMSVHMSENKRDERLMKDMKKPRAHIINHTKVTHSIKKRRHNDTHIYAKLTHKTYDEEKMQRETKNMCHPRISKLDKRAKPYG